MANDEPVTWADGALAAADLNTVRNALQWLSGWSANPKPFARIRSASNVPLSNDGDWSDLVLDTTVFDIGGPMWGSLADFTIPVTGIYLCGACVRTEPTTANKALRLYANGTTTMTQHDNIGVSTPAFTTMNVSTLYQFDAGDTFKAQVFQDSGGTINAVVEGDTPVVWCCWYAEFDD